MTWLEVHFVVVVLQKRISPERNGRQKRRSLRSDYANTEPVMKQGQMEVGEQLEKAWWERRSNGQILVPTEIQKYENHNQIYNMGEWMVDVEHRMNNVFWEKVMNFA